MVQDFDSLAVLPLITSLPSLLLVTRYDRSMRIVYVAFSIYIFQSTPP